MATFNAAKARVENEHGPFQPIDESDDDEMPGRIWMENGHVMVDHLLAAHLVDGIADAIRGEPRYGPLDQLPDIVAGLLRRAAREITP
jgi:hypothetical protein